MDLLPAIDLKDGAVVRLTQGDYAQTKIYSQDPVAMADHWIQEGAEWLHIVDLDAALEGQLKNFSILKEIGKTLSQQGKKFEIGGGIREAKTLSLYLEEAEASRVILGTIAYQKPDFVKQACLDYPGKIAVGIDIKNGKLATHGWTETQETNATDFSRRMEDLGVTCIIYTDVQRDGMLSGLNFDGISNFIAETSLPVVVAGGLRDLQDIEKLLALQSPKILGAITGKAIYEGTLNFKEAMKKVMDQVSK